MHFDMSDNRPAENSESFTGAGVVSDFSRAVDLIETDADTAAIHALLEDVPEGGYRNLYTSVTYGPSADFASVPTELDEARYDGLVAIRVKLPIASARKIVSDAAVGSASIDNFVIAFALHEVVEGFRPLGRWNWFLTDDAMSGASSWRREWIGSDKTIAGIALSHDSTWNIVETLSFLEEGRWLGIPFRRHPEKLGDLDEVWPSPILLRSQHLTSDSSTLVDLDINRLQLDDKRLRLVGTAYSDGLITQHIDEYGGFPKTLGSADCVDLRLLVDGIIMDQTSGCFIKSIVTKLIVSPQTLLSVPGYKARRDTEIPIGAADASTIVVGAPVQKSVREHAWAIGRAFREEHVPNDAERFFDPVNNPQATNAAFADLGSLGGFERGGIVTIMDPYALEKQALLSILALAMPNLRPMMLRVYTEFKRPERIEASESLPDIDASEQTNRDRSRAEFYAIAQQVFQLTNVAIEVYETDRLHDRFILIGDRVWHVGPSFNTLGQEVAALVEMRDRRRKAELRAYLDRLPTEPVWKTQ